MICTSLSTRKQFTRFVNKLLVPVIAVIVISVIQIPKAEAARCTLSGSTWTCTYNSRSETFNANNGFGSCNNVAVLRTVRWQVPEGTPPSGGWPVAFYYNGTVTYGSPQENPFSASSGDPFGFYYLPQIFHELLDDPAGTGKKYAVIAAEAPTVSGLQFWDTNSVNPYSSSGDYCFLPDLFGEIAAGNYGSASQYNLNKRYAFGISSGGYNTSRMAVTFNSSSVFKALAIVSASYATCSGSVCSVPTLPSNHPPTKFWHGTSDTTVPESTMELYYNKLVSQGIQTAKVVGSWGHQFTADDLGSTGIQNWFNQH